MYTSGHKAVREKYRRTANQSASLQLTSRASLHLYKKQSNLNNFTNFKGTSAEYNLTHEDSNLVVYETDLFAVYICSPENFNKLHTIANWHLYVSSQEVIEILHSKLRNKYDNFPFAYNSEFNMLNMIHIIHTTTSSLSTRDNVRLVERQVLFRAAVNIYVLIVTIYQTFVQRIWHINNMHSQHLMWAVQLSYI